MKIKISYFDIMSDHILASPEFSSCEVVEANGLDDKKLDEYIISKQDFYGHHYKKEYSHGFDYISNQGAVKVEIYEEPKVKRLT